MPRRVQAGPGAVARQKAAATGPAVVEAKAAPRQDRLTAAVTGQNALQGELKTLTPMQTMSFGEVDPKLDKSAIRTWARHGDTVEQVRTRPLRARDAKLPEVTAYKTTSEKKLTDVVKAAHAERLAELKAGNRPALALATPEDGSVTAKAFHMAALGSDQTGWEFPLAMARIGEVEGFRVVVRVSEQSAKALQAECEKLKLGNVTVAPLKNDGWSELDFWSEDQGELHVDGSVSVPRSIRKDDGIGWDKATFAVYQDRLDRLYPGSGLHPKTTEEWTALRETHPDVFFAVVGGVSERGGQRAIAAVAVASGRPLHVTNGYLEGGNTLIGRRAGGTPFALVGKDSLVVSKAALEKDLRRELSDDELRALIAADLGVEPAQLIAVEQAGDFHIDMQMMLLPGGQAVVNDPLAVFAMQKEWMTADLETSKPKPPAPGASKAKREDHAFELELWQESVQSLPERLAELETAAKHAAAQSARLAQDLEAAGLTVHRMAGVFPTTSSTPAMNFLNGELAKSAVNGDGFGVLLGGDVRAEEYVRQKLLGELPSGLTRLHFLDRALTPTTLQAMGGLSCRAKLEGA